MVFRHSAALPPFLNPYLTRAFAVSSQRESAASQPVGANSPKPWIIYEFAPQAQAEAKTVSIEAVHMVIAYTRMAGIKRGFIQPF
jgi:hypothetical protein